MRLTMRMLLPFILILVVVVPRVLLQDLVHIPDAEEKVPGSSTEETNTETATASPGQVEAFVATGDWQVVKEGQSIPKGLHVRMNLQTGIKEAKLLAPEPDVSHSTEQREVKPKKLNIALEEALKNIATSHDEPSGNKETVSSAAQKQKFRSIEEITEAFAKQNVTLSSEMEILTKLYAQLAEADQPSTILSILEDVEFYVHNFDNAVYFADLGGVALLTRIINNSIDVEIKAKAALTVGSAAQSNVYVASTARSCQTIPVVVRQLRVSSDDKLINRLLFALSSLVRTSDEFVEDLTELQGGEIFKLIIENKNSSMKAVMKVYTLMSDLLGGDSYSEDEASVSGAVAEFLMRDDLSGVLCRPIGSILLRSTDVSHLEKLLIWLQRCIQKAVCKEYSADLVPVLTALETKYRGKLNDPDFGDYYKQICDSISKAKSGIIRVSHHGDRLLDEL